MLAGTVLAALALQAAATVPAVPVVIGKNGPELDACSSTGQVSGINPKAREPWLNVRNAPRMDAKILGRLQPGALVTMCDTSGDGQWEAVVYSDDPDADCGTASPVDRPRAYRGPCKSGWVASRFLVPIAG
jgi:uncharacterized protein YgiM (DUF1202 family)